MVLEPQALETTTADNSGTAVAGPVKAAAPAAAFRGHPDGARFSQKRSLSAFRGHPDGARFMDRQPLR